MKKIFTLLFVAIAVLQGCSGGDEGSNCSKIDSLTATQQIDKLHYTIIAEGDAISYEILYGDAEYVSPNSGNGSVVSVQSTTGDIDMAGTNLGGMTVNVYARAVCADGSKSKWTDAVVVAVSDFCERPRNVHYDGSALRWDDHNWDQNVSQYQVKYGESGFSGGGTTFNTNTTSLDDIPLAAQTSYDFYVRANCGGGSWSAWEGPYTYYSENQQNMCQAPTELTYVTLYNNGSPWGAEFHYNGNGEMNFEYALMNNTTSTPSTGQLNTIGWASSPVYTNLSQWTTYKFWIRGICADGSRTAWSTLIVDL